MNGKGDRRRPGKGYAAGWDAVYKAVSAHPNLVSECPHCKEIELRPTGVDNMRECSSCGYMEQI